MKFLTLTDAVVFAAEQILQNESKSPITHTFYEQVVHQSSRYKAFVTGRGQEAIIEDLFGKKNSWGEVKNEEILERRLSITKEDTVNILEQAMNSRAKFMRVQPLANDVTVYSEEDKNDGATMLLLNKTKNWNGENLELLDWLAQNLILPETIDPNIWAVVEIRDYDPITETPTPYLYFAQSEEVLNFKIDLGEVLFLNIRQNHYEDEKGNKIEADKFSFYTPNHRIIFKEHKLKPNEKPPLETVDFDTITDFKTGKTYWVNLAVGEHFNKSTPPRIFEITPTETAMNVIPAWRIGYKKDKSFSEIYQSWIAPVESNIERIIYFNSEKMMQIKKHLHPLIIEVVSQLKDRAELKARNGESCDDINSHINRFEEHKDRALSDLQSGEIRRITMDLEDVMELLGQGWDLDKLYREFTPPIDVIKETCNLLDKEKEVVLKTLTGALQVLKTETLGERKVEEQNRADIGYFAQLNLSNLYKKITGFVFAWLKAAHSTEITPTDTVSINLKFPKHSEPKDLDTLLNEVQSAKTLGDVGVFKKALTAYKTELFADDERTLQHELIWDELNPFFGKSEEKIEKIKAQATSEITVNFNPIDCFIGDNILKIRHTLESRFAPKELERFYGSLNYLKRMEIVKSLAQELMLQITVPTKEEKPPVPATPPPTRLEKLLKKVQDAQALGDVGVYKKTLTSYKKELFKNDPEALEKELVWDELNPFFGKSEANIAQIKSEAATSPNNLGLSPVDCYIGENMLKIRKVLESKLSPKALERFYTTLNYLQQMAVLTELVEEMMEENTPPPTPDLEAPDETTEPAPEEMEEKEESTDEKEEQEDEEKEEKEEKKEGEEEEKTEENEQEEPAPETETEEQNPPPNEQQNPQQGNDSAPSNDGVTPPPNSPFG